MTLQRTQLFVSYSHHDAPWLERLQVHLRPLARSNTIELWDDTRIQPGARWQDEIARAVARAKIAVLLVSADFLASDYVVEQELPRLLASARDNGAVILPVIVSASAFGRTEVLKEFQAVNKLSEPLNSLPVSGQEEVLERVAEAVELAIGQQELRARVEDQQRQIEAQQHAINELVRYMVAAPIFRHLCGVSILRRYQFWDGPMSRELYFLRDIGFIQPRHGDFAPFDASIDGANLVDLVEPTPIGWSCVRLRKSEIPQDWLRDDALRWNLREDVVRAQGL